MSILDWLFNTEKQKEEVASFYTRLSQDLSSKSLSSANIGLSFALLAAAYATVAASLGWFDRYTIASLFIVVFTGVLSLIAIISAYMNRMRSFHFSNLAEEEFLDAHPDRTHEIENISSMKLIQQDIRRHPVFYTAIFIAVAYLALQLV